MSGCDTCYTRAAARGAAERAGNRRELDLTWPCACRESAIIGRRVLTNPRGRGTVQAKFRRDDNGNLIDIEFERIPAR
jgi:hypothetical protein